LYNGRGRVVLRKQGQQAEVKSIELTKADDWQEKKIEKDINPGHYSLKIMQSSGSDFYIADVSYCSGKSILIMH
jgi:hypothetical protein